MVPAAAGLVARYNVAMVVRGRRWLSVAALLALLVGCGPREEAPPQDLFKVRLLTSSVLSGRWERAAEQGLGRIAVELEGQVGRRRCAPSALSSAVSAVADEEGMDLIFCVGAGFENALFNASADHPDVRFVVLPADSVGGNVAGLEFVVGEAGFLGGVVAALLSDQAVTGVIRGAGRPWLARIEEGYAAGFASRTRAPRFIELEGANAPWELVREGATVALYAADTADPAVLAAAHDAGLNLIAVERELLAKESDVVVAAVSVDVSEAFLRIAREVQDGSFRGTVYTFDLGSGVVDLELGPALTRPPKPELIRGLEDARTEVAAGIVAIEELGL